MSRTSTPEFYLFRDRGFILLYPPIPERLLFTDLPLDRSRQKATSVSLKEQEEMNMNSAESPENQEETASSTKIWITALGTGILFWTSLFGLIFFCLRT